MLRKIRDAGLGLSDIRLLLLCALAALGLRLLELRRQLRVMILRGLLVFTSARANEGKFSLPRVFLNNSEILDCARKYETLRS